MLFEEVNLVVNHTNISSVLKWGQINCDIVQKHLRTYHPWVLLVLGLRVRWNLTHFDFELPLLPTSPRIRRQSRWTCQDRLLPSFSSYAFYHLENNESTNNVSQR